LYHYAVLNVPPDIEGWLSDAQGRFLRDAAASTTGRGAIVEIGSWKGRSTAWLALGARSVGRRLYAIDPHTGSKEDPAAYTLQEFLDNLAHAGVADVVDPLVMTSSEAARVVQGPVELLFIDGDHSPGAVLHDVELWLPRLADGGFVMFHDVATTSYSGPRRAFQRYVCWCTGFDSIARIGSMTVARRTGTRTARAAIWGPTAGVLLYLFDVKSALKRALGSLRPR
jgi:predicted O-methyltransferase YrrM